MVKFFMHTENVFMVYCPGTFTKIKADLATSFEDKEISDS